MDHKRKPKIVVWDLETLPDPWEVYKRLPGYGSWPGRGFNADIQGILCFGYKVIGNKKPRCINRWQFDDWDNDHLDDKQITKAAYDVLHDADEIVTQNGKKFDLPLLNTRLSYHGYGPLPRIKHVDTKEIAKKHLSLFSNSLSEIAKHYKLKEKMQIQNKWDLWYRIARGINTKKDLKLMSDYCKQDVEVTHLVYDKMKPYHINSGVNKNFFSDERVCNICGSKRLKSYGWVYLTTLEYRRYRCLDCLSWIRTDKKDKNPRAV